MKKIRGGIEKVRRAETPYYLCGGVYGNQNKKRKAKKRTLKEIMESHAPTLFIIRSH